MTITYRVSKHVRLSFGAHHENLNEDRLYLDPGPGVSHITDKKLSYRLETGRQQRISL